MKIKVAVAGTVGKSVLIDTAAGARLGQNLFMPDGTLATSATLAEYLGIEEPAAAVNHHRLLQGLALGDDHPQYTRKDTLTTRGDVYYRNETTVARLALGTANQILRSNGTDPVWYTPSADPTASIGLAAVNGVANTFMRSDAAPALAQNIAPSWTALHRFTNSVTAIELESTNPRMIFDDTNAGSNRRIMEFNNLGIRSRTDADAVGRDLFTWTRSAGGVFSIVNFGNTTDASSTTYNFRGPVVNFVDAASTYLSFNNGAFTLNGPSFSMFNIGGTDLFTLVNTGAEIQFDTFTSSFVFRPGGAEVIRFAGAGDIGLSGANYGNAGDVLTSAGAGAPAAWVAPATVASGTYTPTLTNVANLDASTAYQCQWSRSGNTVTVSGRVDVDPTLAATSTQLGISLPVASNLGTPEDCSGVAFAAGVAGQGAAILGDATNDRAQLQWVSGDITNQAMYFVYAYEVI